MSSRKHVKKVRVSFEELVRRNKEEIMNSKLELEKIEKSIEKKQANY
jgi:hypothetical protein